MNKHRTDVRRSEWWGAGILAFTAMVDALRGTHEMLPYGMGWAALMLLRDIAVALADWRDRDGS